MLLPTEAQQLLLSVKPTSFPNPALGEPTSTFTLHKRPLPCPLPADHVLLKTRYISNDPAQRSWISGSIPAGRLYCPPVELGVPMRSRNIFEVIAMGSEATATSDDDDDAASTKSSWGTSGSSPSALHLGALVTVYDPTSNQTGWVSHVAMPASKCTLLPPLPHSLSPTHYLGALGTTGLTAYFGLTAVARTTPDDTVLVSAAAGATGSLAVQLAKHVLGCRRVVGIARGTEKCALVCSLGADACLDYTAPDFPAALAAATSGPHAAPSVFFDNVGGAVLDAALGSLARGARVVACGAIAAYNREGAGQGLPMPHWFEVVSARLEIRGFIVLDYAHRFAEVQALLRSAVADGRIVLGPRSETVVPTRFADVPRTWMKLFDGGNVGKLVTEIVD